MGGYLTDFSICCLQLKATRLEQLPLILQIFYVITVMFVFTHHWIHNLVDFFSLGEF